MATYEIALSGAAQSHAEVVTDLPLAEIGEVIFYRGSFWRVDEIQPSVAQEAEGRMVVSRTTDTPDSA